MRLSAVLPLAACGPSKLEPTTVGDPDMWWFGAHIIGMCDEYTLFAHLANAAPEDLLEVGKPQSRTYTFPTLALVPHTLTVALRLRAFLPQTIRALGAAPRLDLPAGLEARVKVRTMAEQVVAVTP